MLVIIDLYGLKIAKDPLSYKVLFEGKYIGAIWIYP